MKKKSIKCYIDTNILVGFKAEESKNHKEAKAIIENLVGNNVNIFISPLVVDEYLMSFVKIFRYFKHKLEQETLKTLLNAILKIPNLQIIQPTKQPGGFLKIVDLMYKYKLRPRDAFHLNTTLENKIQYLATLDKDFDQVFSSTLLTKYNN